MPLAVLVNTDRTASSADHQSYAHVIQVGAMPTQSVHPALGAPESEIDLESAATTVLAARDIEEPTSSSVSTGSPFGI